MFKFIVSICFILLFVGCSSLPPNRVLNVTFPEKSYSFYSGDNETVGDVWSRETTLVHDETGKEITLLGMYHIADKEFYRYVQKKVDDSDVILAEGVSGKSSLSVSSFFYTYMFALYERGAHWQRLSSQNHELRIPPEKYVNADISMKEMSTYGSWKSNFSQLFLTPLAIITVEPTLLLSDVSDWLHWPESAAGKKACFASRRHMVFSNPPADGDVEELQNSLIPGVITPRNDRLLKVISEQLYNDNIDSILVPWGAAHLQDIEDTLIKRGFTIRCVKWLKTISVKAVLDSDIELVNHRVVRLPYIYTYYRYPMTTEHNILFQLLHVYNGDDCAGVDLGYGHILKYLSDGDSSYFSFLPLLFGRPLFFDYTNIHGEGRINALLFLSF